MKRWWVLGLAVVLGVVAVGCGDDHDASTSRRAVYQAVTRDVIAPVYEQLDTTTAQLTRATETLCATPGADALARARSAWTDASQAWNRSRAFRFGPVTTMRSASDIGFMVDTDKIDAVLDGESAAVVPPFTQEAVGAAGADVRGLAAIEHVLFIRDATVPDDCAFAASAAALVAAEAASVRAAWLDGSDGDGTFARDLADPGNGSYANSQAALDDLVNGMAMALDEATKGLADVAGTEPGARAPASDHRAAHLLDTLWSVRAIYTGAARGDGDTGIGALVADASSDADARFRSRLRRAVDAVEALPADLDGAPAAEIADATRRVRALGTITRAEVASMLGVTLSLSDSDGDS